MVIFHCVTAGKSHGIPTVCGCAITANFPKFGLSMLSDGKHTETGLKLHGTNRDYSDLFLAGTQTEQSSYRVLSVKNVQFPRYFHACSLPFPYHDALCRCPICKSWFEQLKTTFADTPRLPGHFWAGSYSITFSFRHFLAGSYCIPFAFFSALLCITGRE